MYYYNDYVNLDGTIFVVKINIDLNTVLFYFTTKDY